VSQIYDTSWRLLSFSPRFSNRTRNPGHIHIPAHIRIRRSKGKETVRESAKTTDCTRQQTSANRCSIGNIRRGSTGARNIPGSIHLDIRYASRCRAIHLKIRWSPGLRPLEPRKIQFS
jgi:hypothetical protein